MFIVYNFKLLLYFLTQNISITDINLKTIDYNSKYHNNKLCLKPLLNVNFSNPHNICNKKIILKFYNNQ